MDTPSELKGDEKKWAESTQDELYTIAKKIWAKKFTTRRLRLFQAHYTELLSTKKLNDTQAKAIQNRWDCATFAISIREFGE